MTSDLWCFILGAIKQTAGSLAPFASESLTSIPWQLAFCSQLIEGYEVLVTLACNSKLFCRKLKTSYNQFCLSKFAIPLVTFFTRLPSPHLSQESIWKNVGGSQEVNICHQVELNDTSSESQDLLLWLLLWLSKEGGLPEAILLTRRRKPLTSRIVADAVDTALKTIENPWFLTLPQGENDRALSPA